MSESVNSLINKINRLDINRRTLVTELVNELVSNDEQAVTEQQTRESAIAPNVGVRTQPRKPNHHYISEDGVPLAIGDRVEIRTTRKVGREGDIAQVQKFNRKYVAVTILRSGESTQRVSKYLRYLE